MTQKILTQKEIKNHPAIKSRDYWSPSRHTKVQTCPRQYSFKYNLKVPDTMDENVFLYGSLIHEYLETDKKPDMTELLQTENGLELNSYIDEHYELMRGYGKRLGFSKKDNPEMAFLLKPQFPSGKKPKYNFWIYGIADRIVNTSPLRIIDYKSRATPVSKREASSSKQFTYYIWAWWVMTGEIHDLFILTLKRGSIKNGKPAEVRMVKTTRTLEDLENLMDEAQELWEKGKINRSMERSESNTPCFMCPFKNICKNFD